MDRFAQVMELGCERTSYTRVPSRHLCCVCWRLTGSAEGSPWFVAGPRLLLRGACLPASVTLGNSTLEWDRLRVQSQPVRLCTRQPVSSYYRWRHWWVGTSHVKGEQNSYPRQVLGEGLSPLLLRFLLLCPVSCRSPSSLLTAPPQRGSPSFWSKPLLPIFLHFSSTQSSIGHAGL